MSETPRNVPQWLAALIVSLDLERRPTGRAFVPIRAKTPKAAAS